MISARPVKFSAGLLLGLWVCAWTATGAAAATASSSDPAAERLIKEAMDKLATSRSLEVDMSDVAGRPRLPFRRTGSIRLMRPNLIRVEEFQGTAAPIASVRWAADGHSVWRTDNRDYIWHRFPQRPENFYVGPNPMPQYFFTGRIAFDPADSLWGTPISLFSANKEAYAKSVTMRLAGKEELWGETMQVVEIRFNTRSFDITERIYLKDGFIYQVSAESIGTHRMFVGRQFKNYRLNPPLTPSAFAYSPPDKAPVQDGDPVRLGEIAPDFELPLNHGGSIKLKDMLKKKKGLLIVTLDGRLGRSLGPDVHLAQMKVMQRVRDKFKAQGLEVVAVVGGNGVTPAVQQEMLRNWLPDQTRFSYPIAIDVDLERGIQGNAFYNFQLNGRNNILLDKDGRVVFACEDLTEDPINELALYQALSQIGFAVSAVDLQLERPNP